mmetsp:Transcript_75326/g.189502  ORF Transcript_75326/g.189502 Transcript_75326/m.189502 type:complete len:364 (-) Transcript_75326:151-1242(-)
MSARPAAEGAGVSSRGCCSLGTTSRGGLLACPPEILWEIAPRLLDSARPIGQLACASRGLAQSLCSTGRGSSRGLRVGSISTCCLTALVEGLTHVNRSDLELLRLDLSAQGGGRCSRVEVERALWELSRFLPGAAALRKLSVRLASFDVTMERLRLGTEAWEALIRGLGGLAHFRKLQSLELSYVTMKASQATHIMGRTPQTGAPGRQLRRAASSPTRGTGTHVAAAAAAAAMAPTAPTARQGLLLGGFGGQPSTLSLREPDGESTAPLHLPVVAETAAATVPQSFLEVLQQLTRLEELRLTHDEIFGSTAQLLPPVLKSMRKLQYVDLTRNHIPKQVMKEVRAAMPKDARLVGDDQQTFFFY